MKVCIIGANGQLGTDLVKAFAGQRPELAEGHEVIGLTHAQIEICDFSATKATLSELRPQVVINTAAFHRTDACEDEPERAFLVNAIAVRHLAQTCAALNATLVHISTDYVFDGKKGKPYTEEDTPCPLSVYGVSKLAGEFFVRSICPKHYIARGASLFGVAGASGKGGNFVETMIKKAKAGEPIRVVNDIIMSPTYTHDMAQRIRELLEREAPFGVYHVTNSGFCSWFEFARTIFELCHLSPELSACSVAEMPVKAKRPSCSALKSVRISSLGLPPLRPWRDALKDYLQAKGHLYL